MACLTNEELSARVFRQAASGLRSQMEAAPAHRQSLIPGEYQSTDLASRQVSIVVVLNSLLTVVFRFPLSGQYPQQPSGLHRSRRPHLVRVNLTFVL